jgi:hypothetical protein
MLDHESLISVAHERRFVGWPRLALWIKANQENLFVLRQAEIEANEWKDHSYDLNYLWPDERLKVNQYLAAFGDAWPGVELAKDGLPDIVWCEVLGGEFIYQRTGQIAGCWPPVYSHTISYCQISSDQRTVRGVS